MPWRPPSLKLRKGKKRPNQWKILVSEIMLQQTQVERVASFFKRFIRHFPTPAALARAPLKEVLLAWQGLGYNRRALLLKRAAEIISREHGGEVPRSSEKLDALPGIGAYTAGAIMAFAWNEPAVFIETNIRTVFLHFFFKNRKKVHDKAILELVRQTLPVKVQPFSRSKVEPLGTREWYGALMDYGAHLKETIGNLNAAKSAHYAKQSRFKGSWRELRAEILRRAVRLDAPFRATNLSDIESSFSVRDILSDLSSEGFLKKRGQDFILQS